MATLNTISNVVGNYGSTAADATITFATTASATITVDSIANNRTLSVGDVLVVTGGLGASGYTVGQELTITSINYTGATAVVDTAAAGVATTVTARLKNADTDRIASSGGTKISEPTDITNREFTDLTINAGIVKTLVTADALATATACEVLFVLDSVTTVAGVAVPGAIFQLQLTDGTDTAVLANLSAGDTFYSSRVSSTFYDVSGAAGIVGNFALKNTSGTNYVVSFRIVVAS